MGRIRETEEFSARNVEWSRDICDVPAGDGASAGFISNNNFVKQYKSQMQFASIHKNKV